MIPKRLRMFAGPNGSGKSTIYENLKEKNEIDFGIYLNADQIERQIKKKSQINLNTFGLNNISSKTFSSFIDDHSLNLKASSNGYKIDLICENNIIYNPNNLTHSYEASILVDFIRSQIIRAGKKLTFETVMSHESKIEILKFSKENGYKNYLYYISTEDVSINKSRVNERVIKGGHPVPENKIETRYYNSLNLLKKAVQFTYRTYIFDNSGNESKLILDIYKGKKATIRNNIINPWITKFLIN